MPRLALRAIVTLLILTFSWAGPNVHASSPRTLRVFSITDLTTGPDGNLWFSGGNANDVGRVTPTGKLSVFSIPTSFSSNIVSGGSGALYFSEVDKSALGRISTQGAKSQIPLKGNTDALARAPDGSVWFSVGSTEIGRLAPGAHPSVQTWPIAIGISITHFVATRYGNLWFTDFFPHTVPKKGTTYFLGRVSPNGKVTEFPLPPGRNPDGIAVGADGNLWYIRGAGDNVVGRMTPTGAVKEFPLPKGTAVPQSITAGPDHSVWITADGAGTFGVGVVQTPSVIYRVTRRGKVTSRGLLAGSGAPGPITVGPDGHLWFVETSSAAVYLDRLIPGGSLTRFPLCQGKCTP